MIGLLGRLTPPVFTLCPPTLKAQEPQRSHLPSGKGPMNSYSWYQRRRTYNHHIQPNQEREPWEEEIKKRMRGKKKCGPVKNQKRHQPHTSGQCSFHSAYILALLWSKRNLRCNKQTNNTTDIRTQSVGARERRRDTVMCKEKATGLRLRVKAEVIRTGDDDHLMSAKSPMFSNLAVPRVWKRAEPW